MVQPYLQLLPSHASSATTAALVVAAAVGAVVWLTGNLWSRWVITLFTVLLGATIGMQMPQWFGWNISGAGPAVGMAVVLGVTGYAVHGGWVGVLLGTVLALWAGLVTWVRVGDGQAMGVPILNEFTTFASFAQDWWHGLPPRVARLLPYTSAAAMVTGLACAILWTRLTTALAWSLSGVTLIAGCGLAAVHYARPEWLEGRVPGVPLQVVIVAMLVLIGTLIQLKLTARRAPPQQQRPKSETSERPTHDD
jgi:hypothetical protein